MTKATVHRYLLAGMALFHFTGMLVGCAILRREVPQVASAAWLHPEETPLGRGLGEQIAGPEGQPGFLLLGTGLEALSMRAGLAENAQRTLDLQYYALHEDVTT